MGKPRVGDGRIPFELEGKDYWLEPSLEACLEISKMSGGLGAAVERCRHFHFETICAIIGAGLRPNGRPLNPRQRDEMIPKAVYEAGVIGVAGVCIEFLTVIMNGGRPLPPEDEEEPEGQEDSPLDSPT